MGVYHSYLYLYHSYLSISLPLISLSLPLIYLSVPLISLSVPLISQSLPLISLYHFIKPESQQGRSQKAEKRPVIVIFFPNSRAQMFEGHLVRYATNIKSFELTEQVTRPKLGQTAEPINMRNSNKSHLECLHPVTRNYVSLTLIQI